MKQINKIEQEKQIAQLYIERMQNLMPPVSEFDGIWGAHLQMPAPAMEGLADATWLPPPGSENSKPEEGQGGQEESSVFNQVKSSFCDASFVPT